MDRVKLEARAQAAYRAYYTALGYDPHLIGNRWSDLSQRERNAWLRVAQVLDKAAEMREREEAQP